MSLIGLLTATEKQVPLGKLASGQASYETHSVASQEKLEGSRITGKGNSSPKDSSPTPQVVDQGAERLTRPTSAPNASCHSGLHRRLGCSLR